MLVLKRVLGEEVVIGEGDDAVVVTVVAIVNGSVRLGFTAREDIPIDRREIWEQKHLDALKKAKSK
jgi:carbon storage regulator CsrA